jgi:hypothetical protein
VYGSPTYGFPTRLAVVVPLTTVGVMVTTVVEYERIVLEVTTAPVVALVVAVVVYDAVIVEVINSATRSLVSSVVLVKTYVQFSMLASWVVVPVEGALEVAGRGEGRGSRSTPPMTTTKTTTATTAAMAVSTKLLVFIHDQAFGSLPA